MTLGVLLLDAQLLLTGVILADALVALVTAGRRGRRMRVQESRTAAQMVVVVLLLLLASSSLLLLLLNGRWVEVVQTVVVPANLAGHQVLVVVT